MACKPTLFHIPVCPFSQRVEILLALKGKTDAVAFEVVDITKPRDPALLAKSGGNTALPMLEIEDGRILRESLVVLEYLESLFPDVPVRSEDPWPRAIEAWLVTFERELVAAGYTLVMNQDLAKRAALTTRMLEAYASLDAFLVEHGSKSGPFLGGAFGWAETVFTSFFVRFGFLDYYEGFDLPDEPRFARVRAWRAACLAHPAAQQVTHEEVVKAYYDYAKGAGNGALLPGRMLSSFVFEPHWSARPWPPRDKYGVSATDADLGLVTP